MNSKQVLSIFDEITKIPRESGHEELITAYLLDYAERLGLEAKRDEIGNVVIIKEAAPGFEKRPTIVLQSHSDMVCEKNEGVEHDFSKDPIKYEIEDGWLIAKDTTLGADCGIGVAAQLAVLGSDLNLGRIEALFTVSEETGLYGAKALKPGFITGKILINLDSEDEGELFVGCAGGMDTTARLAYTPVGTGEGRKAFAVKVAGGIGGHSGDDIDKGRANAVQLLARFLYTCLGEDFLLCSFLGGNKRNAIAREASAVIAVPDSTAERVRKAFGDFYEKLGEDGSDRVFFGIDVIVGFPGETEADFMDTYNLLSRIKPAFLHVFPYSRRPGTPAASMPGQVPEEVKNSRVERLMALSGILHSDFVKANSGRREEVLFESSDKGGRMYGYTRNYIRVERPFDPDVIGRIIETVI